MSDTPIPIDAATVAQIKANADLAPHVQMLIEAQTLSQLCAMLLDPPYCVHSESGATNPQGENDVAAASTGARLSERIHESSTDSRTVVTAGRDPHLSATDKLVEVSDLKEALIIGLAALGYLNPEQTDKHWNTLERKLREIEKRAENSVQSANSAREPAAWLEIDKTGDVIGVSLRKDPFSPFRWEPVYRYVGGERK